MRVLDHLLDDVDIFGRFRVDIGRSDIEARGVFFVFLDIPAADGQVIGAFLVGFVDDFVVDIGEILDVGDLIAQVLEPPAQHVERADGAGVADMDIVIDGWPAGVDFDFSRFDGGEFLFFPC